MLMALVFLTPGEGTHLPPPHRPIAVKQAGLLLSRKPLSALPQGAAAGWQISYSSRAENGNLVEISGVVFIPEAMSDAPRPIVAWAHGTVGIADRCAPSASPQLFADIPGLKDLLARGYVVVASDFQGLGTPGPHPYLVGISSGNALLDGVRAARSMREAQAGNRFVLWGESQGAHAALWAADRAPTYAPELKLAGVAAAAPPTDLVANFTGTTSRMGHAFFSALTTAAWSQIYGLKLSSFANPFGRYVIRSLARDCVEKDQIAAGAGVVVFLLSGQVPYHVSPGWRALLERNSVRPQRLAAPLLLVQGTADDIVRPALTRAFAVETCRLGTNVTYRTVPGAGHIALAERSTNETIDWIAARLADTTSVSGCRGLGQSFEDKAPAAAL